MLPRCYQDTQYVISALDFIVPFYILQLKIVYGSKCSVFVYNNLILTTIRVEIQCAR